MRFRYIGDPLFLASCALYTLNRWIVKPHVSVAFLDGYFNDLLLIPCALPLILLLHRKLGLRKHDDPPTVVEVAWHLGIWAILFEFAGPRWMPHTVADPLDIVAYIAGAAVACLWWNRNKLSAREYAA